MLLVSTYLYPNSRSSPQPPHVQSLCNWRGRELREHPHIDNWPSRQARAMKLAADAAAIACTNAISGEPVQQIPKSKIMHINWMCNKQTEHLHCFEGYDILNRNGGQIVIPLPNIGLHTFIHSSFFLSDIIYKYGYSIFLYLIDSLHQANFTNLINRNRVCVCMCLV